MNVIKKISVIMMLLSLTACASTVHRTVHYQHRPPTSHVSAHTAIHRYQPIEVTVFVDRVHRGSGVSTFQLIIADGEYAEISIRNRKGNDTRIYAHYFDGDLHFDSDRSCRSIQGASRFKHDNGWHKGHLYTRVSVGKDYDLTGVQLKVKNVDQSKKSAVAKNNELQQRQGRNVSPEDNNASKNPMSQERFPKKYQKQTVVGRNIDVSQKQIAKPVAHRTNNKTYETETQASFSEKLPDFRPQNASRDYRKANNDKRKTPATTADNGQEEKGYREESQKRQNVRLSKNEPNKAISSKHEKPEKSHKDHVDKSNNPPQPSEKVKNSVSEKKLAQKDRIGKKDKNDHKGEEDSEVNETSKGVGKNRKAS